MPVPTPVRIVALLIGLSILAVVWFIGFFLSWGLMSGAFFLPPGSGRAPSFIVIAIGVLSYVWAAAMLFGKRLR